MSEPEIDHVEFSGAVLEGDVYLRALDIVCLDFLNDGDD